MDGGVQDRSAHIALVVVDATPVELSQEAQAGVPAEALETLADGGTTLALLTRKGGKQ